MLNVQVDIGAIKANIRFIKSVCKSRVCAVVKANAYGHGAARVAKAVNDDVYAFAVATEDEAFELVQSGIKKKIYVLGVEFSGDKLPNNVIPSVFDEASIKTLCGKCERVSIKVNTGMNRFGCRPLSTTKLYERAFSSGLTVDGIFTHLYDATNESAVEGQYEKFAASTSNVSLPILRHFAASSCIYLPEKYHFDMVRTGLSIYGYGAEKLVPAMRVLTTVVQINKVERGEHIGYGDTVAVDAAVLATLRIGYGDGIRRNGRLTFTINGKKCQSVGNICMDACMVDVTGIECKVGDIAKLDIEAMITEYNITEYEALTAFNGRAKRIYIDD